MRYIINDKNYVTDISFGCPLVVNGAECTEYTGTVPSGYSSLEEWYREEELTLWRWKILEGNLTLDSTATAPEEGQWGVPKLQSKMVYITDPSYPYVTVTPDAEFDGLSSATVRAKLIGKSVTPSLEPRTVTPSSGYVGLSFVNVEAASVWESSYINSNDVEDGMLTAVGMKINAPTEKVPLHIVIVQRYGTKSQDNAIAVLHILLEPRGNDTYAFFVYGYTQGGTAIFENAVSAFNGDSIAVDHFQLVNRGDNMWELYSSGSGFYSFDTTKEHHVFVLY